MYVSKKVIDALDEATTVLAQLCGHEYDYSDSCDILCDFKRKAINENVKREKKKKSLKSL